MTVSQVPLKNLSADAAWKRKYATIKNRLTAKGKRPTHGDPQDNTFADTLDAAQYRQLMIHMESIGSSAALRNRALCAWLQASIGRSDEGRMIYLADMMAPCHISCIGKVFPVVHLPSHVPGVN